MVDVIEDSVHFLSVQTLIAILLLLVYTIAAPIFSKLKFHYIHESGISMILGLVVASLATLISPDVIDIKVGEFY
jgi:hypothetical protein